MLNINKQEINLNTKLKKKIDWSKNYASIDIKVLKGHLIRLEPTNIAYIEPHRMIINEVTFMFFNNADYFYVNDFDNDLKEINEKLKILNRRREEQIDNTKHKDFDLEKVLINRDTETIIFNSIKGKEFLLAEWNLKSKEDKQEFISKYVESITFVKNKKSKYGLELVDIELKSTYKEKLEKVAEIGALDFNFPIMINDKEETIKINSLLTEEQFNKYLKEIEKNDIVEHYRIKDFEESFENFKNEPITIDAKENQEIYKIVPIINKKSLFTKNKQFNLEVIVKNK